MSVPGQISGARFARRDTGLLCGRSLRGMLRRTAVAVSAGFLAVTPLAIAQDSSASPGPVARTEIRGVVQDESGGPLPGAEVLLEQRAQSQMTSASGEFSFANITDGTHKLLVRKIGWMSVDTVLVHSAAAPTVHRLVLRRLTVLDTTRTIAVAPWRREFEENRRLGLGRFVTREEIERRQPGHTLQLLAPLAGLKVVRRAGSGSAAFVFSDRGLRSFNGKGCGGYSKRYADVWVDGVPVYLWRDGEDEGFDVNSIHPEDIQGIEYYVSPAQTPAKYQRLNTTCGVLVIWTKRLSP